MRSASLPRFYRRTIVKHFGSTRNFLVWSVAVVVTIYFIDSYVLTRDRLQSLVKGESDADPNQPPVDHVESGEDLAKKPATQPHKAEEPKEADAAKQSDSFACGLKEACPAGKYAYLVRSGYGRDGTPTICFNGNTVMGSDKAHGKRGINMVVINDKKLTVEDLRYFDTYSDGSVMMRYLKLGVPDNYIILAATLDEATLHLTPESRSFLHQFGSSLIDRLGFRDNMVLVGQRGLAKGSAIEKHMARVSNVDFAEQIEISGCLSIPMGQLHEANNDVPPAAAADAGGGGGKPAAAGTKPAGGVVKVGEELPQCGVTEDCGAEAFPVHFFSGTENREGPKICVSGKYVLANGLNDGGRGFNVAIVDPKSKDVLRVGHFDTYAEDSSNLEIFLEMMNDKEIIIAVTHDDASKNFNLHAQKIMESLGASMISKLTFRDVWGFVGQKGIVGVSTLEQIEFVIPGTHWPRPIDKKICVPTELKGSQIKPDPLANKNEKRRNFCGKYDGYGEFCEMEHIDEPLVPAPLADKALENNPIFTVPIIVIPGLNHNAVRMQLETLLLNPGINSDMVTVLYDEKFAEPASLAELFNFKAEKLSSSNKYIFQMEKALEKVWELYPTARSVIVFEEEVIPGQDLLGFLGQVYPAVIADSTLAGITAWNDNGYQETSGDAGLVLRVNTFPGLGFLIKRLFYEEHMKGKMAQCCYKRSWDGWALDVPVEMIAPDVSRVYRRPYAGLSEQADFLQRLFNRPRNTQLTTGTHIKNVNAISQKEYEQKVSQTLSSSLALDTTHVDDCLQGRGLGFYIPKTPGQTLSIFYEQDSADDMRILSLLAKCFGAFSATGFPPRALHNGLLWITYEDSSVLMVGSTMPYYNSMPQSYRPIKTSQLTSS